MVGEAFKNPFRPGAGHMPPYLAGRNEEMHEFRRLLKQEVILENMVLTGLRGVGKTVLLDTFKPAAMHEDWLWVGTDLSESTSLSEKRIAIRLMTDLAVVSSAITVSEREVQAIGFNAETQQEERRLDFAMLQAVYQATPGLDSDRLKAVLELVWECLKNQKKRGLVFAYDEAQNLSDHAERDEFPLSLLLDVFQSLQKKDIPFMLVLVGLPTLFPKLVEARTFAERMFRVVFLDRLNEEDSRKAITEPISDAACPVQLDEDSVDLTTKVSGGYPYFIQFICREVFDSFLQLLNQGRTPRVPIDDITRKLDTDFFAGRWARATDRQRDLLTVVSRLPNSGGEFSVQEIVSRSKEVLEKGFSSSHVNQMLSTLTTAGLVYKNRHGKYSFAVPLLDRFIERQTTSI